MVADRRRRRAGFTLIELVCYLALVTAALTTIGGIELAASRAAFVERALLDLNAQQDQALGAFADDVAQAVKADLEEKPAAPLEPGLKALALRLADGTIVRWGWGKDARGKPALVRLAARQGQDAAPPRAFAHVDRYELALEAAPGGRAPFVKLELWLSYGRGDERAVRRHFTRLARPRAWEGGP